MKQLHLFLCAAMAATPAVHAGSRASNDYAVAADDLATAGHRAASTDYTADQSVADGGAFGDSSDYQTRQGYTGQLYDATALTLTATPGSVGETATSQLSAAVAHDDGTTFPLSPVNVGWSIVSGPVQAITAAGLFTPDVVYTNTPARIQGQWGGLTAYADLTVIDTDGDNYHSFAADGIPDSWQGGYFGDSPSGNANADPDGDGQDNLFEYLAGLVPSDPFSHLEIILTTAGPTAKDIGFGPLVPGRNYLLESSTDLALWEEVRTATVISDDGHWRVIEDSRADQMRKFYRITISLE